MEEDLITPTRAYNLLTGPEKDAVDDYMEYVLASQSQRKERIALALTRPIPSDWLRRSRGLLAKPIPRAALSERIREEADRQDLSPSRVIEEYRRIAYASQDDFFTEGAFGEVVLKPFNDIPSEKWAAVKAVRTRQTLQGLHVEIILYDKQVALDKFTKLMGMVAPDQAPILEEYVTDRRERQQLLEAPEDLYAQMLEG